MTEIYRLIHWTGLECFFCFPGVKPLENITVYEICINYIFSVVITEHTEEKEGGLKRKFLLTVVFMYLDLCLYHCFFQSNLLLE